MVDEEEWPVLRFKLGVNRAQSQHEVQMYIHFNASMPSLKLSYVPAQGIPFPASAVAPETLFAFKLRDLLDGRDEHQKSVTAHDLFLLARYGDLNMDMLPRALDVVFSCWGRHLHIGCILDRSFGIDTASQRRWLAFREVCTADDVPLHMQEVVGVLADLIAPLRFQLRTLPLPHANGSAFPCTGSSEPGQEVSSTDIDTRVETWKSLGLCELKPTPEEEQIMNTVVGARQQLAKRQSCPLRPLAPLAYVTSSKPKFEEARRCLAEFQSVLSMVDDVKPPLTDRLPVETLAGEMVRYAFQVVQTACLLDVSYLSFDGLPPLFALGMSEDAFAEKYRGQRGSLHSFLAFTDGHRVHIFDGVVEGSVVSPRGGALHNSWDRIWLPDGYPGTLAELESSAFVVSVRHLPFLELAQELRGRDYSQIFEIHVTVDSDGSAESVQAFKDACLGLRQTFGHVKPVLIDNASGISHRQLMTASHHVGSLPEVHVLAFRLSQALVKAGFRIARTKIEASMSNHGVPVSDEEAVLLSPENYFEFHVKLSLPPDFDEGRLRSIAAVLGARLSRSAFRVTAGAQKRFVTMRIYSVGRTTAVERFDNLCRGLHTAGFAIDSKIREYAVYDSNVHLDHGWIDTPAKVESAQCLPITRYNSASAPPHLERGGSRCDSPRFISATT